MGRSWSQAVKEELPELEALLVEATDDIRHKVIEQAWSGQEQTGYMQNIYGTDYNAEAGDAEKQSHETENTPEQDSDQLEQGN